MLLPIILELKWTMLKPLKTNVLFISSTLNKIMPKPKYIISDIEKNLIHHELYKKTGILIRTKSDCRMVSELIEINGDLISESTLYRMFIQKTTSYTPYMHTLNVLSVYCGFERWQDLIQNNEHHKSAINTIATEIPELSFNSFVQVSIALKEYKVLKID